MIEIPRSVHRTPHAGAQRRLALVVWPVLGCLLLLGCWSFVASDSPFQTESAQPRAGSPTAARVSQGSGDSHRVVETGELDSIATADPSAANPESDDQEPDDSDAGRRLRVLGDWEDEYQGKRYLTLRDDGTGTMVVVLSGIGKKLFAERMEFSLEWQIVDGKITMTTTGGEPKSKVKLVLKLYGDQANYKIVSLDPRQMLLQDADGKTQYDWRRPGDPERTAAIE